LLSLSLSQPQQQRRIQQLPPRPHLDRLVRKDLLDQLELQARSPVLRALQDLPTFAYKPSRG
jgi:hypothetical protein